MKLIFIRGTSTIIWAFKYRSSYKLLFDSGTLSLILGFPKNDLIGQMPYI